MNKNDYYIHWCCLGLEDTPSYIHALCYHCALFWRKMLIVSMCQNLWLYDKWLERWSTSFATYPYDTLFCNSRLTRLTCLLIGHYERLSKVEGFEDTQWVVKMADLTWDGVFVGSVCCGFARTTYVNWGFWQFCSDWFGFGSHFFVLPL